MGGGGWRPRESNYGGLLPARRWKGEESRRRRTELDREQREEEESGLRRGGGSAGRARVMICPG